MIHNRIAIIGLHEQEYKYIRERFEGLIIWHKSVPKIKVVDETLVMTAQNGS